MTIQPYLNFDGRCEEAIDFYKKALGAEVEMLLRFKDCPETPGEAEGCAMPGDPEKVMHTTLRVGDAVFMASDANCTGQPEFKGISLSLTAADEAEADRYFDALAAGGEIQMPMGRTFFSPRFGMVADRFGVSWMVIVEPEQG
jgi:PhnB protein